MSVKLASVKIDCVDALTVPQFWSAALGRYLDAAASSEFASIGVPEHRDTTGWSISE